CRKQHMKYVNFSKNEQIRSLVENNGKKQKKSRRRWPILIVFSFLLIFFSFLVFGNIVRAIFDPISIVANINNAQLKETDGRTNVLVLGSDKRSAGNMDSTLTDTILVASIGRVEKDVILLSLPRDLWVKSPQGFYTKINAVYAFGGAQD